MQREDITNFNDLRAYIADKILHGEIIIYSQNAESVQKFMYAQGIFCANPRVYVFMQMEKYHFAQQMHAKGIDPEKIFGIEILDIDTVANINLKVYEKSPQKTAEMIADEVITILYLHGITDENLQNYIQQTTILPVHVMDRN